MKRGTLLFLEEDRELQSLVSTYLRERGYQVELAQTVQEARDVLASSRVDAAIVDGLLTEMEGTRSVQQLREVAPELPVLFASASWQDPQVHDRLTRQLKVNRVLHKPYTPQELYVWVEQVLTRPAGPVPEALAVSPAAGDDVVDPLAALSAEYGARLGEKVRELTAAVEQAREGRTGALENACALAHKLHGTAGAYGFGQVSTAAGRLEEGLGLARQGSMDWNALQSALQEVASVASRVTPMQGTGAPGGGSTVVVSGEGRGAEEGAAWQTEPSRILVLDDDPDAVRALSVALSSSQVEVVGISEPYRLMEALAEHRPDLLLLDVEMPGPSGFDLCRIVRSKPEWQALPILFITAHTGVEFRVAAFQAGADDYLAKPVMRQELRARVHSRLERARLARERSERDSLTGLLLRRPFLESLNARLAEVHRQRRPLALGFLDVDRFKKINDTHGHLAGDRVLTQMGRLLSRCFRKEDLRCRWGGEEFVVALLGESVEGARTVLGRMASELAKVEFQSDKGEPFQVTFSAGVAVAARDGMTLDALLRVADERMYRAKAAGGNRVEVGDLQAGSVGSGG
jgi:diguanylate cyclase (GGDEF)-like protein